MMNKLLRDYLWINFATIIFMLLKISNFGSSFLDRRYEIHCNICRAGLYVNGTKYVDYENNFGNRTTCLAVIS